MFRYSRKVTFGSLVARRAPAVTALAALIVALTAAAGAAPRDALASAMFRTSAQEACPCRIWGDTAAPEITDANDGQPIEIGVKFRSDIDGYITALRFYKGGRAGKHTGNLWSAGGKNLAGAVFAGETASGWQQVTLAAPVRITADTTYVASYFSESGDYAATPGLFVSSGVDSPPLHALAAGVDGGNGVFKYGTSGFPTETFNGANYWVDVVFHTTATDTVPPAVTGRSPAANATAVQTSASVTATFNEDVTPGSITFVLRDPTNALVPASVTYDQDSRTVTLKPDAVLKEATAYTVTLSGATDLAGNPMAEPVVWSFATGAPSAPPVTTPAPPEAPATPPAPPVREQLSISVTLDRGPGATYYSSEQITVCVTVSRTAPVSVTFVGNGRMLAVIFEGTLAGRRCFQQALPLLGYGGRSVKAEALDSGQVVASDEVGFEVDEAP
jgi:hypothetical protein